MTWRCRHFFKEKRLPLEKGAHYHMMVCTRHTRQTRERSTLDPKFIKKVKKSIPLVDDMENAIQKNNEKNFFKIIQNGWDKKRKTSKLIQSNVKILELDAALKSCKLVKAHRLCGAGGGGYYLVFTEKETDLSCHIKNFNSISCFSRTEFSFFWSAAGIFFNFL